MLASDADPHELAFRPQPALWLHHLAVAVQVSIGLGVALLPLTAANRRQAAASLCGDLVTAGGIVTTASAVIFALATMGGQLKNSPRRRLVRSLSLGIYGALLALVGRSLALSGLTPPGAVVGGSAVVAAAAAAVLLGAFDVIALVRSLTR